MLVACGDDDGGDEGDRDPSGDAGDSGINRDGSIALDGGMDGSLGDSGPGPNIDGSVDSGWRSDASIADKVIALQISATGHDGFLGVTYDQAGNIYALGFTSAGKASTSDYSFALAKFLPDGGLDTSFGTGGYAVKNVAEGGQNLEQARGIAIQPDGRIVVSGDADHTVPADPDAGVIGTDTDIVLARFNANGTIDESFGTAGVVRHNLNDGVVTYRTTDAGMTPQLNNSDSLWNMVQTTDGKLVIHARSRAAGSLADGGVRTDSDYTLVRLTADGALDLSFGGTGIVRTDFEQTSASVRAATVLSDGSIVASGYTTSEVLGTNAQQPVLYKVRSDGTPDPDFAATDDPTSAPGVWHGYARPDMRNAEAYNAAVQGTKYVTIGYGPTPGSGMGSDWVLFRFNADGSQDRSFGVDRASFLDPGGYADNGRGLVILPDNRILGVGGARPKPAAPLPMGQVPQTDATIAVFGPDGQPDESFAPGGFRLYNFGGQADFFHSAAVSPDRKQAVVVGVAGAVTDQQDNDAVLVQLELGN